ncbi:MAG TPA: LamG domain-containing protein [Polyangia bacterium]|nr:LamG domain-containing protein [Polyangia bacterium]
MPVIVRPRAWALVPLLLTSCGGVSSLGLGDAGGDATSAPSSLKIGLEGAWSFDGDGSDHAGKHLDLATTGLHFAAGHFGKGIVFAGDGTPIAQRPIDDLSLNLATGDFTVSFWIDFAKTGAPQFVAMKGYDPGWFVGWAQTQWAFGPPKPAGQTFDDPAGTPSTGTFHHVVFERTGDSLELFVDGASAGKAAGHDGTPSLDPFQVGGYAPGGVAVSHGMNVVSGTVDDLGIWRRALLPEERAYLKTHAVP